MALTDREIEQILDAFMNMTTERQYIGARYVPIFGRKDEDSIIWDNTRPYEALTIVLYEGNSYTSRQYVPAGIEITNEDFWANTGNYNAQIEAYREEVSNYAEIVDQYENDVKPLKNKTVMIFGDSTMVDVTQNTSRLADLIAAQCECTVIVKAVGGTSLDHLITTLEGMTSSDFVGVDYAFFAYCTNDWQGSTPISRLNGTATFEGRLETAFGLFYQLTSHTIPVIVTPAYGTRNFTSGGLYALDKNLYGCELADYVDAYLNFAYENGIACIDLFHKYGINHSNVTNYFFPSTGAGLNIYVHYNQAFKEQIAKDIEKMYPFDTPMCPYNDGVNTLNLSAQLPLSISVSESELGVILSNAPKSVKSYPAFKVASGSPVTFKCTFSGDDTLIFNHKAGVGLIIVKIDDEVVALVTGAGQCKIRLHGEATEIYEGELVLESTSTQYICGMQLFNGNHAFTNTYGSQNWIVKNIPASWIPENGSMINGYLAIGTEFNILHTNNLKFTENKAIGDTILLIPEANIPIRNFMFVGAVYITGTGYTPMLFIGERNSNDDFKVMASQAIPANTGIYIEQVIPNYRGCVSNVSW